MKDLKDRVAETDKEVHLLRYENDLLKQKTTDLEKQLISACEDVRELKGTFKLLKTIAIMFGLGGAVALTVLTISYTKVQDLRTQIDIVKDEMLKDSIARANQKSLWIGDLRKQQTRSIHIIDSAAMEIFNTGLRDFSIQIIRDKDPIKFNAGDGDTEDCACPTGKIPFAIRVEDKKGDLEQYDHIVGIRCATLKLVKITPFRELTAGR